jgi:hypothetical protein
VKSVHGQVDTSANRPEAQWVRAPTGVDGRVDASRGWPSCEIYGLKCNCYIIDIAGRSVRVLLHFAGAPSQTSLRDAVLLVGLVRGLGSTATIVHRYAVLMAV